MLVLASYVETSFNSLLRVLPLVFMLHDLHLASSPCNIDAAARYTVVTRAA